MSLLPLAMPRAPRVLRPYQELLSQRVRGALGRARRVLAVLPTGGGKTVVAADLIERAVGSGRQVLFLAHRRELIDQASRRLQAEGIYHGVVLAGDRRYAPHAPVQVASIQTLASRGLVPAAQLVIVDEAHHAIAGTYTRILARYPESYIVGLTATPCRLNGTGLASCFDLLVVGPTSAELLAEGHLIQPAIYAPPAIDTRGLATRNGDYAAEELAERARAVTGDVVAHWQKLARGGRTVLFACTTEHSRQLVEAFQAGGLQAEHLDAKTPGPERAAILARLAAGATRVVSNVGILTEGWDLPQLEVVQMARPTKSLSLYLQMVGRVMRPDPGKAGALVLDHAGNVIEHGGPEEPRAWTLDGAPKVGKRASTISTCEQCFAVFRPTESGGACPLCGWAPAAGGGEEGGGREVRSADGELLLFDEAAAAAAREARARKADWLGRWRPYPGIPTPEPRKRAALKWLCGVAARKGWKRTAVGRFYHELYQEWPPKGWEDECWAQAQEERA